ncbi:DUF2972 domain-containing protein, partial [Campylobacter sp.]|uniref:DUF2972 domain-containing protein n=1 Tax=Campylobacter sp. TaxID=205 RepID=UPI0025C7058C
ELAWEMNLPLPDNYEFVFLHHGNIGSIAFNLFCMLSNIKMFFADTKDNYIFTYASLLQNIPFIPALYNNILGVDYNGEKYEKIFYLFQKQYTILYIARDPISIIKSRLNHPDGAPFENITENMKNITYFNNDFKNLFPKMAYGFHSLEKADIRHIRGYLWDYSLDLSYPIFKNTIKKIMFINFNSICSKYAFNTFVFLCHQLNYNPPLKKYQILFEKRILKDQGLFHLPVKIHIDKFIVWIYSYYDYIVNINKVVNYVDIGDDICKEYSFSILENIILLADQDTKNKISKNDKISMIFKEYIIKYIQALDLYVKDIRDNLITEEQVLDYIGKDVNLMYEVKSMIDKNQRLINYYNPEYLKTWKYYQEFEKMCEELDGKEESLKENISNN